MSPQKHEGSPDPGEAEQEPERTASPGVRMPADADEWLVDGFNLLHAVLLGGESRARWWTAPQRERAVAAVRAAAVDPARTTVVFDGPHGDGEEHGAAAREPAGAAQAPLRTVFAPSADGWLLQRVKTAPEPGRVVVVTADRRLRDRLAHAGAVVVRPSQFLRAAGVTAPRG